MIGAWWQARRGVSGSNSQALHNDIRKGNAALIFFFGALALGGAFLPLNAAIVAQGVVVVSGSRQSVEHENGGVIENLFVAEGDRVTEGQVLLSINGAAVAAEERSLRELAIEYQAKQARLLAELQNAAHIPEPLEWASLANAEKDYARLVLARHRRERDVRTKVLVTQKKVYLHRREQLIQRIKGLRAQINTNSAEADLISDELEGMRILLSKGFAPMQRVRAIERSAVVIEGERAQLAASIAEAERLLDETSAQSLSLEAQLEKEAEAELRETEVRLADLLPKLAAARDSLARAQIRSPTTGRIINLSTFNAGSVVKAGELIMEIVPERRPLVVEARVRPEEANQLSTGMRAEVRLRGVNQRFAPPLLGRVEAMSADRLEDSRTGQPYFSVRVAIPESIITKLVPRSGKKLAELRVGLPSEIVIPVKERTAMEYLFEPLNRSLWTAMREN